MTDASFSESLAIQKYTFDDAVVKSIEDNISVKNIWPLIYIISDEELKEAYVGETTNAAFRMISHLLNPDRRKLSDLYLITCDK